MKSFKAFLAEAHKPHPGAMYHGSFSGDLRGGSSGLHLGTHEAARQALTARIGHPVEGHWDGTREYGKTKLAGKKTMNERGISITGRNCRAPEHDHYPHEHPEGHLKYADGSKADYSSKPNIKAYHIIGKMSNHHHAPMDDFKANGIMKGMLKRGKARHGYYYRNVGEDEGSVSAVVPNGSHVKEA